MLRRVSTSLLVFAVSYFSSTAVASDEPIPSRVRLHQDSSLMPVTLNVPEGEGYSVKYYDLSKREWTTLAGVSNGPKIGIPNLSTASEEGYVFRVKAKDSEEWSKTSQLVKVPRVEDHPFLSELSGSLLKNADNSEMQEVDPKTLLSQPIYLYFSASWCGPCQQFTLILKQVYDTNWAIGMPMNVVFVSGDTSETEFNQYFAHMPWLAVPHNEADKIFKKFGVDSFPTLLILYPNGDVYCDHGTLVINAKPEIPSIVNDL